MSDLKHIILSAKRRIEKIDVPELGMSIHLRRMNGHERDEYQAAMFAADRAQAEKGMASVLPLQPLLLSLCICDEDGKRVFDTPAEVQEMDGTVLDRLAIEAIRINGFSKEAREAIEKKV